jgi:hypothetical protein
MNIKQNDKYNKQQEISKAVGEGVLQAPPLYDIINQVGKFFKSALDIKAPGEWNIT